MKCYECGAELSDDTRYCSYCGTKIQAKTTEEKSISENNHEVKVEYKETQIISLIDLYLPRNIFGKYRKKLFLQDNS